MLAGLSKSLNHCDTKPRPPEATHRIILSLYVEFEALPEEPQNKSTALVAPLTRDGMPAGSYAGGNGRPRPPKQRPIDLRVGDQILSTGRWRTIKSIAAYRAFWLTEAQAARQEGDDGYVYRLPAEPGTLEPCPPSRSG
jgi:hypothetical protein